MRSLVCSRLVRRRREAANAWTDGTDRLVRVRRAHLTAISVGCPPSTSRAFLGQGEGAVEQKAAARTAERVDAVEARFFRRPHHNEPLVPCSRCLEPHRREPLLPLTRDSATATAVPAG